MHCFALMVLLGLVVVAGAPAAAQAPTMAGGCQTSALAAKVAASCAAGTATPACCEPVKASVELGGGACLCRLASEAPVLHAGLNASALLALYTGCGGAHHLPACHGLVRTARHLPSEDKKVYAWLLAFEAFTVFLWICYAVIKVYICCCRRRK